MGLTNTHSNKVHSKLSAADMGKIIIFQHWYQYISKKNHAFNEAYIIYIPTKKEWYIFCNTYIVKETQNTPPVQTKIGYPSHG